MGFWGGARSWGASGERASAACAAQHGLRSLAQLGGAESSSAASGENVKSSQKGVPSFDCSALM